MKAAQAGWVYLVGAGPGAADLITVRGLRILRTADVVLHDALIPWELLEEARPDAEILCVGKRGYCIGSTRQEAIQDAMIRLARAGRSVCRLKGGDPYIFGRGGEEAEALAQAGIPFEVIPGITAATGACAAAQIPLTHRAVGPAVVLATGHHDPEGPDCKLDWEALARLGNVIFYMASRYRAAIARRLIEHGLSPTTAAAVIEKATTPEQRIVVATLAEIADDLTLPGEAGPSLFIVGECVRHRQGLYLPWENFAEVTAP
jgi:uroporphyrin-III C-methyltransferase